MKTKDFSFNLPEELIAQYPPENRGESRLMVLNRKEQSITHSKITCLKNFIPSDTLMVFNNSRVQKVRLYALAHDTGGSVEFFLLSRKSEFRWEALASKSKKQKPGKIFDFPGNIQGIIQSTTGDNHKIIEFSQPIDDDYLEKYGHVPLPPYIKREDDAEDFYRYQTVFARTPGSMAAPTAGLHFTENHLKELKKYGVKQEFVTLHVGLGTFQPVRAENILDHKMHSEIFHISEQTADSVNSARKNRTPVLAVGTTSIRSLESAWKEGTLKPGEYDTDIFIYPGYNFKCIDMVITNFHTPESTLLMLVSAFAGTDFIQKAYNEAIKEKYRFFSYGDAMLII